MTIQKVANERLCVDEFGFKLAPFGQMAATLVRHKAVIWRGLPMVWKGSFEGYVTGELNLSRLRPDDLTMYSSRRFLGVEKESASMGYRVVGVEDPTISQVGRTALYYTQVRLKENPTLKSWATTSLVCRPFDPRSFFLGAPTVLITPAQVTAALGAECDMVKEAEPAGIDQDTFIFFEHGSRRLKPYLDVTGKEEWYSSSLAYCQPDGSGIHSLRTAEEDEAEHLSTAGAPFLARDGRFYMVYNRRVNHAWSVHIGRLSYKSMGGLQLKPLQQIISPPSPDLFGFGPGDQLIAFGSHVEYLAEADSLTVHYHVNDSQMRRDRFSFIV